MLIGYCRTSTAEQIAGLEEQQSQLVATGCNKLFIEQVSSVAQRDQLQAALDYVREGDTLIATKLDRLARSVVELLKIIDRLEKKNVSLRLLDFGGGEVDTRSPTGRLLITVLGAVAEAERTMMLSRQRIGIAKAKAEGRYRGRAPTARAKTAEIVRLNQSGMRPTEIALQADVSRSSVYRILSEN